MPQPLLIDQEPTAAGVAGFTLGIPAAPSLVGFTFVLQGAHLGLLAPVTPVELSNGLLLTILP